MAKLTLREVNGTRKLSIDIDNLAKGYNFDLPVVAGIIYMTDEEFLDGLEEKS